MKVRVYWNLHKKVWSIQSCKTGLVIDHSDVVHLEDVKFVVRKAGQQRVRKEGKKNVHAFAVGNLCSSEEFPLFGWYKVTYNPYKHETFVRKDNEEPVLTEKVVKLARLEDKIPVVLASTSY